MILNGGENVHSKKVKDVLHATSPVSDRAMIGLLHPAGSETIVAGIVFGPNANFFPDELRTGIRPHPAFFKTPRRFIRLDVLLRNRTGKVLDGKPCTSGRPAAEV